MIDQNFVDKENDRPRIIIGSDIEKIVNLALRSLIDEGTISENKWKETLEKVISEPTLNIYGDGEENVDSIAMSYCRMLRKGFIPTSSNVLFDYKDYHMEHVEEYDHLRRLSTTSMSGQELREHENKLSQFEILQGSEPRTNSRYDKAVYNYLKKRINRIAVELEMNERRSMIMR